MPASNGSNQSSIVNGLGIAAAPDTGALPASAAGSPAPDANQPGNDVVKTAPNNQSPQNNDPRVGRALGVLKAVSQGTLHGVSIPHDAPKLQATGITPESMADMGVSMYRPVSKDMAFVMFNAKQVPVSTLKAMDKAGTLGKAFPPITKFLGSGGGPAASGKGKSGVGTPPSKAAQDYANSPQGAAAPAGASTPSTTDLNLTGTPSSVQPTVPVLPRPGFGAGANQQAAVQRMKALSGSPPSSRANPTAGSIVNGLWSAPV